MRSGKTILFKDNLERLEKLCVYIRDHVSDDLTIPTLATIFHYSETKLKRHFKIVYKTSLHVFVLQCRMKLAKALIIDANYTITEIASLVGYKSRTSFTHSFQAYFGYTPFELLLQQMPDKSRVNCENGKTGLKKHTCDLKKHIVGLKKHIVGPK